MLYVNKVNNHQKSSLTNHLLFISNLLLLVGDEVTEVVRLLGISNNTDVITERVSLEVLLGEVLDVTLSESTLGSNG